MEAKHLEELMVHYNLDHEKIDKMINRAVQACFAFEKGEMTLKQVWYRARGERFQMACQFYPDKEIGARLYELACEFFTELGGMEYVIVNAIFHVLATARANSTQLH